MPLLFRQTILLKILTIGGETTTDEGALSLAAALNANSSMEYLRLDWSSTHPDSTLKNIGECVNKSTLRILLLVMNMPSGEAPEAEERAKVSILQRLYELTSTHCHSFALSSASGASPDGMHY